MLTILKRIPTIARILSVLTLCLVLSTCGGSSNSTAASNRVDIENNIQSTLNTYTSDTDFTLTLEAESGETYVYNKGASRVDTVYESASSSKLVTAVIILRLVQNNILSLHDSPQSTISFWPTTGNLSTIQLHHLLNFTSGLNNEVFCINNPVANFETCIENIKDSNLSAGTPGNEFYYASSHMQVAGLMAIKASGLSSWTAVFDEFKTQTGLFTNARYDLPSSTNPRLAGGMHWQATEYMAFLKALYKGQILNQSYLDLLFSDQIGAASIGNSPALSSLGKNWRYAYGNWIECDPAITTCVPVKRVSSPGTYGAYPFIDFEQKYFGVLARQGGLATFDKGYATYETVANELAQWANSVNN